MVITAMKLKDACSLGKKSYDKSTQCIKKQRHHPVDMVFPIVIYGCESYTIKKAEHQRIDAFDL